MTVKITGTSIIFFLLLCVFNSYFYSIITKEYNGDYFQNSVNISNLQLTFNLVASSLPYIFLLIVYKKIKNRRRIYNRENYNNSRLIKILLFFYSLVYFINLYATIFYGFGVAAAPRYSAPEYLKLIFASADRFNIVFFGCFLLYTSKDKRLSFFIIISLLILGVLKASIGFAFFIAMILLFKKTALKPIKIKKIIWLLLIYSAIVYLLYVLRANLRQEIEVSHPTTTMVFGIFLGRFTSFPDSAIIFEFIDLFKELASIHDKFFYVKEFINSIFGSIIPLTRTISDIVVVDIFNADPDRYSVPLGIQGILYYSFLIHPLISLMNLVFISLIIYLIVKIISLVNFDRSLDFAILMISLSVNSGVAAEYGRLLISSIILYLIARISRNVKH